MKIDDFTPTMLYLRSNEFPNPVLTLVFENEKDPIEFFTKFLNDSDLNLIITKSTSSVYTIHINFPNFDNYRLSMEIPISENKNYERIIDKSIAITCGFKLPDGMVAGLSQSRVCDNKVSLNESFNHFDFT